MWNIHIHILSCNKIFVDTILLGKQSLKQLNDFNLMAAIQSIFFKSEIYLHILIVILSS